MYFQNQNESWKEEECKRQNLRTCNCCRGWFPVIMISTKLAKEVCDCCKKIVNIGQPITECQKCMIINHTKCYSKSNIVTINQSQYCQRCCSTVTEKYNPFTTQLLITSDNNDTDHYYDENMLETLDILKTASDTLNHCTLHTSLTV